MKKLIAVVVGMSLFAVPAFAGVAEKREQHQQQRIAQGVQNGQLTPREAMKLEREQGKLDRRVDVLRARQGGHLTVAQKARIDRKQDALSRQIYRQKHDCQHR